MRVAIAEIVQETDSFNPIHSGLPEFERYGLYEGEEILERVPGVGMLGGFLDLAQDELDGMELIPIIRAWAGACGEDGTWSICDAIGNRGISLAHGCRTTGASAGGRGG